MCVCFRVKKRIISTPKPAKIKVVCVCAHVCICMCINLPEDNLLLYLSYRKWDGNLEQCQV